MSLAESLDEAAAEVLKGMTIEEPTPVDSEQRESVPTADEPVADETDTETESAEPDVTPPAPVLPDGYVAVPTVADKLATDFVLRDAEGEVEVPELMVEYKANGKVRKDRLDQVVKLAQFGVYNEERERKVQAVEESVQTLASEREQLTRLLSERENQLERMLTDEDFLYAVRDAYERQNTPEVRAQRAEDETKLLRAERELAPVLSQNDTFNNAEVVPALEMIARALPSVTMDELEQRLEIVALANAETGPTGTKYIPPSRFNTIRQYISEDLAIWAQYQHARRSESSRPSPEVATARAETDKARIAAQKAKRLVGQATRPMSSANGKVLARKAKPPANVDEAQAQAEREVLASLGL
jgi:hypothetical protein